MRMRYGWAVAAVVAIVLTAPGCDVLKKRVEMKKANELYRAQRYEEAIKEYEKVLTIAPKDWDPNYLKAMSYVALYKPGSQHEKDIMYSEEGIKQFEKLMTLTPPNAEAMEKARGYYLGLLQAADKNDKAIAFLEESLQRDPKNTTLMKQIADIYLKRGEFAKALELHEKVAASDPKSKEAWYTIGVLCWARSYHGGIMVSQEEREQVIQKGMASLEKALAIDPEYFDALSYMNLLFREQQKAFTNAGNAEEAQKAYQKAEEYTKKAIAVRKKQQEQRGA